MVDVADELLIAALEPEAEADQPRALRDVDKAPRADDAAPETTHVDVPMSVDLPGAHERRIQASTIVKIELTRVRNDRSGIRRDAEVNAAGRHATIDARLNGQRDRVGE